MNGIIIDGRVYVAVPKGSRHCSDCDLYEQCTNQPFRYGSMCAWLAEKEQVVFRFLKELQPNEGQVSDGYHTFNELYDFRREYNAALVNTHAYPCHKSLRHSDGELCFGGGWFIVMMELPTGQISNHYEIKYWNEFNCEERECAEPWDGHTDKDVLARLSSLNLDTSTKKQTIWYNINDTPSENSEIVFMDIDGNVFNYTYSSNEDWEQVVETNEITIWAYLDDLTNL